MGRRTGDIAAAVARAERRRDDAAAAARAAVRQRRRALRHAEAAAEARDVLQDLSREVQQEVHRRIAEVVSICLGAVFPDPYTFNIEFEKKRGKTEALITFQRGDLVAPPLDVAGGGTADVAAFALRLASITLRRPPVRRLLVLDEPFRFVSAGYRPAVRKMLYDLAEQMEVQIVMVTHDKELVCGKVIELD